MHETLIARKIIEDAEKQGDVEGISLEIGELAHVPGHELIACLKTLVKWDIAWKEKKARAKCECGFAGHPTVLERGHDHFLIECPKCQGMPTLLSGTDIKIISVRIKD